MGYGLILEFPFDDGIPSIVFDCLGGTREFGIVQVTK